MSMAVFENALALYNEFDKQAFDDKIDGLPIRIFHGSISECWSAVGASQSYYTRVLDTLNVLGCITITAKGRRARPSVIVLHHPPDATEFVFHSAQGLTGSPESARLRARLENLEKRVGGINIADMLVDIDNRVTRLEHLVGKAQEFQTKPNAKKENK
jgi:hypothetical protein